MAEIIYVDNDNLLRVTLKNKSDDTFINDASPVQADELLNESSVDVLGEALALSYVAASDGRYEGTLQNTLTLTVGETYTLKITGTGDSLQFTIYESLKARTRFD